MAEPPDGMTPPPAQRPDRSTAITLWLLTVAAAFSVANLYYAQPLAETMARELHTNAAGLSASLVGTQLGYAIGMLLLVPLGDVRERRGVILVTSFGAALALLAFALAPNLVCLSVASVLVGIGASVTQLILPFAVSLVPLERRGHAIGQVMGGILTGILLSRTASGALGAAVGWRPVFAGAAVAMLAVGLVLRVTLPHAPATSALSYRRTLASLAGILRREPTLRRHAMVGALGFACFQTFWSTIAFQLAASPIHGDSSMAGMLGVLGITGVIVAPIASRLAMRTTPTRINLVGLATIVAAYAVLGGFGSSLFAICAGVVLLDAGVQASHLTNQTVIFGLAPDERNRINAIYMVAVFVGGGVGTEVAAQAWQHGGWRAVCVSGAVFAAAAMLRVWRRASRGEIKDAPA